MVCMIESTGDDNKTIMMDARIHDVLVVEHCKTEPNNIQFLNVHAFALEAAKYWKFELWHYTNMTEVLL